MSLPSKPIPVTGELMSEGLVSSTVPHKQTGRHTECCSQPSHFGSRAETQRQAEMCARAHGQHVPEPTRVFLSTWFQGKGGVRRVGAHGGSGLGVT